MNSKNHLVFQAVFAVGLVGQLLLLNVSRRLVVYRDDVIKVDTDMRHQLIRFGIDRMAVVELRCGRGDQTLVAPSPLVAAFGSTYDPVKLDVLLLAFDPLRCGGDDIVAQGDQMLLSEEGIFWGQLSGVV